MDINIKDLVTLSDDIKYIVISKTIFEGKIYYLFAESNNPSNVKILMQQDEKLIEIEDKGLIRKLLPKLYKEVRSEIK